MLYFGVWEKGASGHHLYDSKGRTVRDWPSFGDKLDTRFCPETGGFQVQGAAALTVVDGWTVLAFWDRSGDERRSSNSVFLLEGTHTFDEMLAKAKDEFPRIWDRFNFGVYLAEAR